MSRKSSSEDRGISAKLAERQVACEGARPLCGTTLYVKLHGRSQPPRGLGSERGISWRALYA